MHLIQFALTKNKNLYSLHYVLKNNNLEQTLGNDDSKNKLILREI